jgi:hypothetical protein
MYNIKLPGNFKIHHLALISFKQAFTALLFKHIYSNENFLTYTYLSFTELIISSVIPDLKGNKSFSITDK